MNQVQLFLHRWYNSIFQGIIALIIAFVIFTYMERIWRLTRAEKPWRATLLDLQYAFLSMFYPPFIFLIISVFFGIQAMQSKANPANPEISWFSFAWQFLIFLVLRDCLIYLRHRIFHLRPVWAFHSIHHSSEEVNWISAVRFHPVENIIEASGETLLFICARSIGVDAAVLFADALFIVFYNFFIHSNLRWTFGPFRYVLVSPVLHRWHHSDAPEARDKNFAAMFSFIDLALGTFYMPANKMPQTVGLSPQEKALHPRTLSGQLLYPFRKR
jgi:sterol desaturase/sphingolipid hydroxylase (fatty acid hydroxylase superfamily)